MAVTIIGTVTARPKCRDELEDLLRRQVEPTRAEPGCINYDFHVDAADPRVFVFYENWTSQAHLDAHLAMPHLAPLISQIDRLLSVPVYQAFAHAQRSEAGLMSYQLASASSRAVVQSSLGLTVINGWVSSSTPIKAKRLRQPMQALRLDCINVRSATALRPRSGY